MQRGDLMSLPVALAEPAKLMRAAFAGHVVAALIFLDGGLAPRAFLRV